MVDGCAVYLPNSPACSGATTPCAGVSRWVAHFGARSRHASLPRPLFTLDDLVEEGNEDEEERVLDHNSDE